MEHRSIRGRNVCSKSMRALHAVDKEELRRWQYRKNCMRRRLLTLLAEPERRFSSMERDLWLTAQRKSLLPLEDDYPCITGFSEPTPGFTKPTKLEILLNMPPVGPETQKKNGWNTEDCSAYIYVNDDALTFFKLRSLSTDCVRGITGFSAGIHIWEINWKQIYRMKRAIVGVALKEAPLHAAGLHCIVGRKGLSWGWDLVSNRLYPSSPRNPYQRYPSFLKPHEPFYVPDTFLVVLDMDEGTLSFVVDDQYLGVAFTGLRGRTLYPYAASTSGYCEVTMKYIGSLESEPLTLMSLCRHVIRDSVRNHQLEDGVAQLNLPTILKKYLLGKDG